MRLLSFTRLSILAVFLTTALFSCNEKEEFTTEALEDYMPLTVGKYITYRVDSLVFTSFGRATEIHKYQVKHVIDAKITDNQGRTSYRVFTFIRDSVNATSWTPAQPWINSNTFYVTPLPDQVEVVENNLRFIKIHLPIRNNFAWNGNRFLPLDPYQPAGYSFNNDDAMQQWDYYYENLNDVFVYKQQPLPGVLNIVHIDERFAIDTVDVVNNKATIPLNSSATYVRGNATDTVIINANTPTPGNEKLIIYNRTNQYTSLNKIVIPPGLALNYQYSGGKWFYPNPLTVVNNAVSIPRYALVSYIFGTATDSIKIATNNIDTSQVKKITVYNKSNFDAYLNNIKIPPGYGRIFELVQATGKWTYYNNINTLLDKDPYTDELPPGSSNYSIEKYAKNVGLVYKQILMTEYQPNTGNPGGAYSIGFGVTMWMIDHN
jgi:hypothetical protein